MMSGRPPARQTRLINLYLLFASSILGAIALDQAILYLFPISGIYCYHPETDYVMCPNVEAGHASGEYQTIIRTNAAGFRSSDNDSREYDNILLLGDSFAFGYGVDEEEAFPAQLELELQRQVPRHYQVINAGHTGYDTKREFYLLKNIFDEYHPRIVIVQFYINDVLSNSGEFWFSPIAVNLLRYLPLKGLETLIHYLGNYPYKLLFKMGQNDGFREPEHLVCFQESECEVGWAATEHYLTQIADYARRHGSSVMLINIPAIEQLAPQRAPRRSSDWASQMLEGMARRLDIAFVDLARLPSLTPAHYFPVDRHWTPSGHALAAAWIAKQGRNCFDAPVDCRHIDPSEIKAP